MSKLIIIAGIVMAVFAGTAVLAKHFKEVGYATCKTEHDQALALAQKEVEKLRAEHATEQEQYRMELANARSAARRVVVKDPAAAAWWVVPVPAAVTDYVYGGVQPSGSAGAVRP